MNNNATASPRSMTTAKRGSSINSMSHEATISNLRERVEGADGGSQEIPYQGMEEILVRCQSVVAESSDEDRKRAEQLAHEIESIMLTHHIKHGHEAHNTPVITSSRWMVHCAEESNGLSDRYDAGSSMTSSMISYIQEAPIHHNSDTSMHADDAYGKTMALLAHHADRLEDAVKGRPLSHSEFQTLHKHGFISYKHGKAHLTISGEKLRHLHRDGHFHQKNKKSLQAVA